MDCGRCGNYLFNFHYSYQKLIGFKIDLMLCENDCNGRGTCFNGLCTCDANWSGRSCQTGYYKLNYCLLFLPFSNYYQLFNQLNLK